MGYGYGRDGSDEEVEEVVKIKKVNSIKYIMVDYGQRKIVRFKDDQEMIAYDNELINNLANTESMYYNQIFYNIETGEEVEFATIKIVEIKKERGKNERV